MTLHRTTTRISAALRQQQKSVALAHLRFKKSLEEVLTKRLGALQNLESTLMSVEMAAGDIEVSYTTSHTAKVAEDSLQIMKTYEKSTTTLQAILSHPSLQRERVEETIDALAAANATAREVDDAIKIGSDMAAAEIDDSDLEAELKELVKEVENEREEAEEWTVLEKLQSTAVPEHNPVQTPPMLDQHPVAAV